MNITTAELKTFITAALAGDFDAGQTAASELLARAAATRNPQDLHDVADIFALFCEVEDAAGESGSTEADADSPENRDDAPQRVYLGDILTELGQDALGLNPTVLGKHVKQKYTDVHGEEPSTVDTELDNGHVVPICCYTTEDLPLIHEVIRTATPARHRLAL